MKNRTIFLGFCAGFCLIVSFVVGTHYGIIDGRVIVQSGTSYYTEFDFWRFLVTFLKCSIITSVF